VKSFVRSSYLSLVVWPPCFSVVAVQTKSARVEKAGGALRASKVACPGPVPISAEINPGKNGGLK
jgi:hypothetical protein